jgi:two-component system alkaline phosphatase synthesis response regulator PhoP
MTKILLVEDQEDLLHGLAINLGKEGYEVLAARRGDTGLQMALKEQPDLILLDVMLPGLNGLDVCRELRQKGCAMPIIMLTAKAEEIDRVLGLEIGADDYVTKPFGLRELLARIRVCLRRQPSVAPATFSTYRFGQIEIDFDKLRATRAGTALELTPREFDMLRLLIRCRGEVVTRDRMLNEVWGYDAYPTTRTVDTHILKLRQKIEDDPANPQYILTIYGGGYKFIG